MEGQQPQLRTLFLSGVPNDNAGTVMINEKGVPNIMLSGSTNLSGFLRDLPGQYYEFYLAGKGKPQPYSFPFWPTVILNQISDPDSHEEALNRCINLVRTQSCPVINKPEAIQQTGRDAIYQNLQGVDGLTVPKTVRFFPKTPTDVIDKINTEEFSYPVIFRKAGDHGGISTSLIEKEEDVEPTLYQYALDGSPHYITQFVDYPSSDGNYRKCRLVVVDGKAYIRHMIVSDSWLIHAASRTHMNANPQLNDEEMQFLQNYETVTWPKIASTITEITKRLDLEYYGIDCNIDDDGNILAFEINANMNVMANPNSSPNRWEQPIETIRQAVLNLIKQRSKPA